MPCHHMKCRITVSLIEDDYYEVDCANRHSASFRVSSAPVSMRIGGTCHLCGGVNIYHGSISTITAGATAWPRWLLDHMATLAAIDPVLRRACIACHVPGIQEDPHA